MPAKKSFSSIKRHKRFLLVVFFLIVLIGAVLSLSLYSDQKNVSISNKNQKTSIYSNSTFNFSLTYPATWKEVPPENTQNGALVTFQDPNFETNFREITIYASKQVYANTIPNWEDNFEVARVPAYKQVLSGGQNPPQVYVYFQKDGTYFTFQLIDSGEMPNTPVLDQMLQSLHFSP